MHFGDSFLEDYLIHDTEHWAADHFSSLLSNKLINRFGILTYLLSLSQQLGF